MTTATVTGPLAAPDGSPLGLRDVVVQLIAGPGAAGHGVTAEILDQYRFATDIFGQFSIDLELNSEIDPAPVTVDGQLVGGTVWWFRTGGSSWIIRLTAAGTYRVGDPTLQVADPSDSMVKWMPGTPGPPLQIAGHVANEAALPSTGAPGALWITDDTTHAWTWITSGTPHWLDVGQIEGLPGITGDQGPVGTATLLGYAENTADTTIGASLTPVSLNSGGLVVNFTLAAATTVRIDWGALVTHSAAGGIPQLQLYIDGILSSTGYWFAAVANAYDDVSKTRDFALISGAHNVEVKLCQSTAVATAKCLGTAPNDPAFLRVAVA